MEVLGTVQITKHQAKMLASGKPIMLAVGNNKVGERVFLKVEVEGDEKGAEQSGSGARSGAGEHRAGAASAPNRRQAPQEAALRGKK